MVSSGALSRLARCGSFCLARASGALIRRLVQCALESRRHLEPRSWSQLSRLDLLVDAPKEIDGAGRSVAYEFLRHAERCPGFEWGHMDQQLVGGIQGGVLLYIGCLPPSHPGATLRTPELRLRHGTPPIARVRLWVLHVTVP